MLECESLQLGSYQLVLRRNTPVKKKYGVFTSENIIQDKYVIWRN